MAKPSITLRNTKGSALTYSELDTNFTNLKDATISITGGSGGTQVTSDLNGNITLVAGSNVTITGDNTAKTITISSSGGGGGSSDIYASLGLYGNQTISSTTDTVIQWTTKSDPLNWFSGSPNYRITPTEAGRYFIALQVHWVDTFNGYQSNIQIRKNANTVSIALDHFSGASTDGLTMTAITSVYMNGSTDYIDTTAYNGYTSSADIKGETGQSYTQLEIFKI